MNVDTRAQCARDLGVQVWIDGIIIGGDGSMNCSSKPYIAAVFILPWAVVPARSAVVYTVVDLGTLGGTYSVARGINSSGQVVGNSATSGNASSHAFLYDGSMHDLGTLGGSASDAYGINSTGQIVGWASLPGDFQASFVYNGTMHNLGTLGGSRPSTAMGVNDSGQIVGESGPSGSNSGSDPYHAFLYNGTMHDLGTFGGRFSGATAVNSAGQVTGFADTAAGADHAFFYDGFLHDLGTLGGGNSVGSAINSAGRIVGTSALAGDTQFHAFLYDGSMHDIGTFGGSQSDAWGINGAGLVVGDAQTSSSQYRAFLYSTSSGIRDLNDLIAPNTGWVLTGALGINDFGQIAGYGTVGGQQHAFRLDPVVPEPTTASLLVAGIMCFAVCRVSRLVPLSRKRQVQTTRPV
jgi:probable HAF family extracellular repeat protein